MTVFVLGGGTLGRFIADIAADSDGLKIGGFFDDRYPAVRVIAGIPVVGRFADAEPGPHRRIAIGVGRPEERRRLFVEYRSAGFDLETIIHPTAVISRAASIGEGVIIGPLSTVLSGSSIGTGCCLLSHANINHDTSVGPWCLIGAGVAVGNGAIIGEGCHVAMGRIIRPGTTIPPWSDAA